MQRYNSFYSLNVFSLHLGEWEFPRHQHNFYELIFIEQGSGQHLLNDLSFPYKKGDVFLLTPDDAHEFEIRDFTVFTFVKFTEQLFIEKLEGHERSRWVDLVKAELQHSTGISGSIIRDATERKNVFALLQVLKDEYQKKRLHNREVVLQLFGAMLVLICRNLNRDNETVAPGYEKESEKLHEILSYIRMNLLDSQKMAIDVMASHFHMSPNYISIYVKKHTGISIQQHVMQTRLKMAEQLLAQSQLTIGEIALRLGFNDASHFNKLFKKYKQVSPSEFVK